MAGLDIGTLTGQIAIEDQFSSTFDLIIRKSEQFVDDFDEGRPVKPFVFRLKFA